MVNADGVPLRRRGRGLPQLHLRQVRRRILAQPGQFAWQVFDSKVVDLLRDEYRIRQVTKVQADTLEELAVKLEGVDPEAFLAHVAEYNAAVMTEVPFDPSVKDGRGTRGLAVRKSNWANRLDEPPYVAFQVTCGITFTFGGLRITPDKRKWCRTRADRSAGCTQRGRSSVGCSSTTIPAAPASPPGSVFGRMAGEAAAELSGR